MAVAVLQCCCTETTQLVSQAVTHTETPRTDRWGQTDRQVSSDSAAWQLINVLTFAAAAVISNIFMIITSCLLQPCPLFYRRTQDRGRNTSRRHRNAETDYYHPGREEKKFFPFGQKSERQQTNHQEKVREELTVRV